MNPYEFEGPVASVQVIVKTTLWVLCAILAVQKQEGYNVGKGAEKIPKSVTKTGRLEFNGETGKAGSQAMD